MYAFAVAVSIAASVLQLVGYWIYNRKIAESIEAKGIKPNATTWGLWALGSIPVVILYQDLTDDWVKGLVPTVCAFGAIATFVHMMVKGTFQKPDRLDVEIFILDLVVVFYWMVTKDPSISTIFLEIDIWITFIPIFRTTWKLPETENPKPWYVWAVAYTLWTVVVLMRYELWWDLILPVNYIFQHGAVGLIARFRKPAKN
jgi:hypothetical protein